MKKIILLSSICILQFTFCNSQNFNLTLSSTYTYSTGTIANIGGWKSPTDGKEYALVGAHTGLSIVDVTNPAAPVQITLIPGPSSLWREVKTYGNYAYVTTEFGTSGLQIVNLTNLPTTPLPVTTWTPTIGGTQLKTIHALHVDEPNGRVYLYGSNVGNQRAIIADIKTNPIAPVYLGSYDNRYIHDGYVRGDTLYACHINQGDCEIVNVTNPAAGVSLADWTTPGVFTHNSWLSKDSKTVFTTDEVPNSFLTSYDLSNLSNVTELDRIQSGPGKNYYVHNTHILQKNGAEYAVTSWYTDGVVIVDVTRPGNMVEVGHYDTAPTDSSSNENADWGVYPFLPSGNLVVSDMQRGLFVFAPNYVRASYLEGVVTDCNTGNPVNGVKVQILNPPSVNSNSAIDLTDALGKYGVGVATAGTYSVTFSKQVYVSQTFTVAVTAGNITTLNVQLCTVTPPFSYTGNVFNNTTTAGVGGANVHLQDNTIVWDTVTDASGNFTIPAMLSGTYDIVVGKWGYFTKCLSAQVINSTSTPITIGLDAGIYDDFSFDFGWTVSGTCLNKWERCVPIGTYDSGNGNATANPDKDDQTDCSNQCYVTDNGGGAAYDHDVDPPGYTILTSPVFDPTIYPVPVISYTRWFYDAQLNANPPNDTMNILISNGSSTVLLERMINNTSGNGTWVNKMYKISSFITPTSTMQLIVSTSDAGPGGTIVEGGLDKFLVFDSTVSAVNEIMKNTSVTVYPNPFSESTTLLITNTTPMNFELKLFNIYGKEVRNEFIFNSDKFLIRKGALCSGMYFYKIISDNRPIASGKLLID